MTTTDPDLRDALAPLRAAEPTDDEIAAVLAAAAPEPPRRRRRWRLAAAVAAGTAAAGVALAALPGSDDPPREPQTAAGLLRSAAAVAADQPESPAWAGYRYVKSLDRWTEQPLEWPKRPPKRPTDSPTPPRPVGEPYTVEKTTEIWVDRHWHGRRVESAGRLVAGRLPPNPPGYEARPGDLSPRDALMLPREGPYAYGDGSLGNVPLAELPTDPKRLRELLTAAYKDRRWAGEPGERKRRRSRASDDPKLPHLHYDVLRSVLLLLTNANVTAEQRAALIGVLAEYQGVRPLPSTRDHLDREGRGVEISTAAADREQPPVRVIFAPDTSELLEWSQPGEVHTFVRTGHVAAIGDHP